MASPPRLSAEADAAYRQGTIFGLTVAEIFILLLFLLMLAFLALTQSSESAELRATEHAETQSKLQLAEGELTTLRDEREKWEPVFRAFERPEEIVTLHRDKAAAEREAARARRVAEAAQVAVAKAVGAEEAARTELGVLLEKGQNPPCWYRRVPDGRGGEREKPYYTFDVAVFERHMVIRQVRTPPGGAEDDTGGTYRSEALALGLDRIPYDTDLSDQQVVRLLSGIHRAGKVRQVRSYSCIFWVRVWDMTPPDAKDRWKRAHDVILEGMFGAYTVADQPWSEDVE